MVINSILAGVFTGIVARFFFAAGLYSTVGAGVLVFASSAFLHHRWQIKTFVNLESRLKTLFPDKSN